MMRPLSPLHLFLLAFIALSAPFASAGLPDYSSRTIESKNGQYVLVLLTPRAKRWRLNDLVNHIDEVYGYRSEDDKRAWIEEFKREQAIEEKYPVSGLYADDGSTESIWKVPYISTCQEVYVANDGIHMVVMYSPWDSTCSGTRQLSFYTSGAKKFSYGSEYEFVPLISMRLLLCACLGTERPVDAFSHINDSSTKFIVHTTQQDKIVFDLATGARLRVSSPWPFYFGFPVVAIPLCVWMWHKKRPRIRHTSQRTRAQGLSYSLGELLEFVFYLSLVLAAVKFGGWYVGACVLIAATGAATAGFRNHCVGERVLGATLALYGAYLAALCFAMVDDLLINKYEFIPLSWSRWDRGWGLHIPLGMILVFTISGAWIARRMCSEESP